MSRHPSVPRAPQGLTLVEVLVVFAILGMSLVVFIPALNQMNEGARAAQCQARIRRLTQGALQFEAVRGGLPAGAFLNDQGNLAQPWCANVGTYDDDYGRTSALRGCYDIFGVDGAPNFGWIPLVLPYIDHQETYDLIDFTLRAQDQFEEGDHLSPFLGGQDTPGRAEPEPFSREVPDLSLRWRSQSAL